MDQFSVNVERLRRDVAYYVADLQKTQHRRLNRLRDDLRFAALPVDKLDLVFSDTVRQWEDAFTQSKQQLIDQGERILSLGIAYPMLQTELNRLATSVRHTMLDEQLIPAYGLVCHPGDRILLLTARAWTGLMLLVIMLAAVLAGLGTVSVPLAGLVVAGAVLSRVGVTFLCRWRMRVNSDRIYDLQLHLQHVTAAFTAQLAQLPDALAQAMES